MSQSWNMGSLIGISSGYWQGCVLQAAVRLELFTVLDDGSLSLQAISHLLGSDPRATTFLLNALSAMNLLVKNGDVYRNTEQSAKLLSRKSGRYIGHIILHHHHLIDGWRQLDLAVRTGKPVTRQSYGEEVERESFQMGMFNLAMQTAPLIAATVDLEGRNLLLDLGGGPGTFAIHFCLAYPGLQAVVFDRPTTEPFMNRTVSSYNLSDRISFLGGDFNRDTIADKPYDTAWLSHVLHSNGPDRCQDLIRKIHGLLEPGGLIMIHDFILDNTKDKPQFAALFALNMLINNAEGRTYSIEEIFSMLKKAGFDDMELLDPQTPNQSRIVTAKKQS